MAYVLLTVSDLARISQEKLKQLRGCRKFGGYNIGTSYRPDVIRVPSRLFSILTPYSRRPHYAAIYKLGYDILKICPRCMPSQNSKPNLKIIPKPLLYPIIKSIFSHIHFYTKLSFPKKTLFIHKQFMFDGKKAAYTFDQN